MTVITKSFTKCYLKNNINLYFVCIIHNIPDIICFNNQFIIFYYLTVGTNTSLILILYN